MLPVVKGHEGEKRSSPGKESAPPAKGERINRLARESSSSPLNPIMDWPKEKEGRQYRYIDRKGR